MKGFVVTIAGGKGGVGKTFVAINIAGILHREGFTVLLVDADVENPSVLASIDRLVIRDTRLSTSFKPLIDLSKCDECGLCVKYCPEKALALIPGKKLVFFETLCNGCSTCYLVCSRNAISRGENIDGYYKYGYIDNGFDVLIGELKPGNRRSSVLISRLIEEHKNLFNKYDYVIIDSPPGTSAGIYSTVKYSNKIIAVTEPTPLGLSDLTKFLELLEKYRKLENTITIINKSGLSPDIEEEIKNLLHKKNIPFIEIPYIEDIQKYYVSRNPIIPENNITLYNKLKKIIDLIKSK